MKDLCGHNAAHIVLPCSPGMQERGSSSSVIASKFSLVIPCQCYIGTQAPQVKSKY